MRTASRDGRKGAGGRRRGGEQQRQQDSGWVDSSTSDLPFFISFPWHRGEQDCWIAAREENGEMKERRHE